MYFTMRKVICKAKVPKGFILCDLMNCKRKSVKEHAHSIHSRTDYNRILMLAK